VWSRCSGSQRWRIADRYGARQFAVVVGPRNILTARGIRARGEPYPSVAGSSTSHSLERQATSSAPSTGKIVEGVAGSIRCCGDPRTITDGGTRSSNRQAEGIQASGTVSHRARLARQRQQQPARSRARGAELNAARCFLAHSDLRRCASAAAARCSHRGSSRLASIA